MITHSHSPLPIPHTQCPVILVVVVMFTMLEGKCDIVQKVNVLFLFHMCGGKRVPDLLVTRTAHDDCLAGCSYIPDTRPHCCGTCIDLTVPWISVSKGHPHIMSRYFRAKLPPSLPFASPMSQIYQPPPWILRHKSVTPSPPQPLIYG